MVKRQGIFLVVLAFLLASCSPAATPAPQATSPSDLATSLSPEPSSDTPGEPEIAVPAPPLEPAELDLYGGVASLAGSSNCTATLIDTKTDSAPAYLITNGHCVGLDGLPTNDTIIDEEGQGEARFFNVKGATKVLTVPVSRFEYATMRGTDVGIVRLDTTLGDLKTAGAVPLAIAANAPAAGTKVINIAVPTQGVDDADQVLRKGACTLGEPVDLIEYRWLWLDALRNDCPGVLGGSSGSPLIATDEIVSIINTTNTGVAADRGDTCYLGKPCEISGDTATFVPGSSYSVNVAGIGLCFPDGAFALGSDCPLPATTLTGVDGGGIFGADGHDGNGRPAEVTLDSTGPKLVSVAQNVSLGAARSCTDAAGYSDAAPLQFDAEEDEGALPLTLPSTNGFTLVCVAERGKEEAAARFVYAIDTVAPVKGPELSILPLEDGEVAVDPIFDIPDIADIHLVFGPPAETDCSDRSAYSPYRRQPLFFEAADLPARFCVVGFDSAGNESPITDQIVTHD